MRGEVYIFMMKKLSFLFFSFMFLFVIALTSCSNKSFDVISTVYPGASFAKAVLGDSKWEADMLVKPGVDIHSYSPSAVDIKNVLHAKLFIYVGGEDDSKWVEEEILSSAPKELKIINMFDCLRNAGVSLLGEEKPISAEEEAEEEEEEAEVEYDSHVWTSITNASIIIKAICDALCEMDSSNKDKYIANTNAYIASLNTIDGEIKDIVANAKTNFLCFGDRFPLLYFVKEYGINYDAAFMGCSSNKDASSKVIVSLTNQVKEKHLSYVFEVEMSSSTVARTIKEEIEKEKKNGYDGPSVEILTFYSMQNITKDDYNKGYTYLDFMKKNVEALRLALN
jgi:zinc transport system substrate-binding protein